MQFALKTYYRLDLLPPVISFVAETARCLGANQREIQALALASEEAAVHIIEHYPNTGLDEQFEVFCEQRDDSLQVVFSNMGLPVNPTGLPKYEASQPEETIDGLGLFLIGKLVDHFEFVNQGRAGWRTVLVKRLEQPRILCPKPGGADEEASVGREKLRVMPAADEHVPGIVELAYRNYGYSYSKEVFYFADQLRQAIADGSVKSLVALNPEDKVVGQMATLVSAESPDVVEFGALMVQPEYRRSTGLLQLIKTLNRSVKNQPDSPALGEANLVTTHTQSQKVCSLFNFSPMALKLSVHGRAKFMKLAEEDDRQRESLLHAVTLTRQPQPVSLFVPARHVGITHRLFENAGIPLEIRQPEPPAEQTALQVEPHEEAGLAVLSLASTGNDVAPVLRKRLFDLESDGFKTLFVRIPGWRPMPDNLDEEMRAMRLFFSGWIVQAPDRWWLLYTRLCAQRFDFRRIQLCDPLSIELQTYIEQGFQEAVLS